MVHFLCQSRGISLVLYDGQEVDTQYHGKRPYIDELKDRSPPKSNPNSSIADSVGVPKMAFLPSLPLTTSEPVFKNMAFRRMFRTLSGISDFNPSTLSLFVISLTWLQIDQILVRNKTC